MNSRHVKPFEIDIFPLHSNQPFSLPLELIERFLYKGKIGLKLINSLLPSVSFLQPLKTLENLRFSDAFRSYKKGTPGSNWLRLSSAKRECL